MAKITGPMHAAYTAVLREAILASKSLLIRNTNLMDNVKKASALLDAVSIIPETMFRWENDSDAILRKRLEYFDSIWAKEESDFSLMKIYRRLVV
ncbi:MAG: hypothetical protein JW904_15420 [Spirochaetales bacterium]|nr:hypothetical protein [Spirochaetales bacterium]